MHALRERGLLSPSALLLCGAGCPSQAPPPSPPALGSLLGSSRLRDPGGGGGELLGPPEFLEPELGFSPRLGLDPPFCTMEPGPVRFGWDPTASDLHL